MGVKFDTEEWAEVVLKEVDHRSTPSCQGTKEWTEGPLCVCPQRSGPKWHSKEWSIGPLLRATSVHSPMSNFTPSEQR